MSKIFYDKYLSSPPVLERLLKKEFKADEREEIALIIDEIIHHKILGCILDMLPKKTHKKFLKLFTSNPFDERLINFLNEKTGAKIELIIKRNSKKIFDEILTEISNL